MGTYRYWMFVTVMAKDIDRVAESRSRCIDIRVNYEIHDLVDFTATSLELWQHFPALKPHLKAVVEAMPPSLICAQIRVGASETMEDLHAKIPRKKRNTVYSRFVEWAKKKRQERNLPVLLWTDSTALQNRFYTDFNEHAVRIPGDIGHLNWLWECFSQRLRWSWEQAIAR